MRIDQKLLRQILLLIESGQLAELINSNSFESLKFNSKEFYLSKEVGEKDILFYHLDFLEKKDFISQRFAVSGKHRSYSIISLEPEGHDFLDAIRSDKVFNRLLEIINKTTESVALETLKALALSASSKILGIS